MQQQICLSFKVVLLR